MLPWHLTDAPVSSHALCWTWSSAELPFVKATNYSTLTMMTTTPVKSVRVFCQKQWGHQRPENWAGLGQGKSFLEEEYDA
ncbi:unnamed protein product [Protopolystoma xenopodis]|uniref:Uncharacterized protein n=1 Tax=Protopolystoma xenopodis TaxID=117903 RepID=A0A3S5B5H2_9PLAT|nr:unnamed protein product [Protopolystoma xenopodis]